MQILFKPSKKKPHLWESELHFPCIEARQWVLTSTIPSLPRHRVRCLQQGKLNNMWSSFWTPTVSAPYSKVNWNCTTLCSQAGRRGNSLQFQFTKRRETHGYVTLRAFLNAHSLQGSSVAVSRGNTVLKVRAQDMASDRLEALILNHSSSVDNALLPTSHSPTSARFFFCAYRCVITAFPLHFNKNHNLI